MRPAVSLIVTTYNIESYVGQCFKSLRDQTFKDFELIIVDDGSTDDTLVQLERATRYGLRNKTIVPLPENTPGGVGTAANVGVSVARGTYIAYADGDDWYEPTMLERLVARAESTNADITIAGYRNFDESKQVVEVPTDQQRLTDLAQRVCLSGSDLTSRARKDVLRLNAVPWRKLYRTDFLHKHNIAFPEGDYFFEDNPYHWMCVLSAESIAFLDTVICHHRINRPGQTMNSSGREFFAFFDHYETTRTWATAAGMDKAYKDSLLGWLFGQLEWISRRIQPSCWGELYERLAAATAHNSHQEVIDALNERRLGRYGWKVAFNAYSKNAPAFFDTLKFPHSDHERLSRIETSAKATETAIQALESSLERLRNEQTQALALSMLAGYHRRKNQAGAT